MTAPLVEALDGEGRPYRREARSIGELPWESRKPALLDATHRIAAVLGMEAVRSIPFGCPVYRAFGLTRPAAKKHANASLLMISGCNLPLSFC